MSDPIVQAHRSLADASDAVTCASRLLSIAQATLWLAQHGIDVHQNTVRHWYRSGRIAVVRGTPARPVKGQHRRPQVLVPESTLAKIAACPFCAGR